MSLTASRIISADELHAAVSQIPQTMPKWQGEETVRLEMTIAPGVLRLSRRDPNAAERAHEARLRTRAMEIRALRLDGVYAGGMTGVKRRNITKFTRQSRARMVRTLCELDYEPLFSEGVGRPAMITLTLPGNWETIAPDVKAYKQIIARFRKMYLRAWGAEIKCVWKNEFQRRGAPHLHMLMTPPRGHARGTGEPFPEWLSRAWVSACQTAALLGSEEAAKHLAAGTGIDYDTKGRWADAKRIAIYYAKHGLFKDKDYQNEPPELWVQAGSVGRFWGYWGLKKAGSRVDIDMRKIRHKEDPATQLEKVVAKCREAGIPISMSLLNFAERRLSSRDIIAHWFFHIAAQPQRHSTHDYVARSHASAHTLSHRRLRHGYGAIRSSTRAVNALTPSMPIFPAFNIN